jgi:hypothetical protein
MTEEINQLIEAEKNALPVPSSVGQGEQLSNVTAANTFTQAVDEAKINVLKEASANDKKFTDDFKSKLKEATLKLAEVEREKANLEKQNIEYHSELLETQQKLNEQQQSEDKWNNRQKSREYHYNGVKPIMEFVGIKSAMNVAILYFLTAILIWFFLFAKLWKGTVGALIAGASDSDRPKAVKGFLWTMIGIVALAAIAVGGYLTLGWLNII